MRNRLQPMSVASLGSSNLADVVKLPKGENKNEWLAAHGNKKNYKEIIFQLSILSMQLLCYSLHLLNIVQFKNVLL